MDSLHNIKTLQRVRELFIKLLDILNADGDAELSYARNVLYKNISCIEKLLNSSNSEKLDLDQFFKEVKESYESMYPPRGGLTEFFIWKDDFDERIKANKPLTELKKELRQIFEI